MPHRSFPPVPLGSLRRGQKAEVVRLDPQSVRSALPADELERRLIEMGLVEGCAIEILHEGFPRRDPIAIRVADHLVALRRSEANAVMVHPVHGGHAHHLVALAEKPTGHAPLTPGYRPACAVEKETA